MLDWFFLMPFAQQLFAGLALCFGTVLLLMLVASLVAGEVETDLEFDGSATAFTLKGILAFLTFFGLGGWIVLRAGSPIWLASLVGIGAGYAVMSTLAMMLHRLRGLDSDGGRKQVELLGQEGEVYLTIPASGQGSGRIQLRQGSRFVEVEALTKGPRIASGERARVVEVLDHAQVLVEAIVRVGERRRTHGYVE